MDILKALRHCMLDIECEGCPKYSKYEPENPLDCTSSLMEQAAERIEYLENNSKVLYERIRSRDKRIRQLKDELDNVGC